MLYFFKNLTKKATAVVLMYHRIADLEIDPWQLAVSPEKFEGQLKVIKRKYRLISVTELLHQIQNNCVKKGTICITFDDGYLDNYLNAKPLLEKHSCPATFFIPPYYVETQQAFWWDELLIMIISSPRLPKTITINNSQEIFTWHVKQNVIDENITTNLKQWIWNQPFPTERCEIYMAIWSFLKPLPLHEIADCLNQLKTAITDYPELPAQDKTMNARQLHSLASNQLFDIGIHTMTHPALHFHHKSEQEKELITCKVVLEKQLNRPIGLVAYPYGNFNDDTLQIMKDHQLLGGLTTDAQLVNSNSDIYRLGRFQASNQNQHDFNLQLKQWFKQSL